MRRAFLVTLSLVSYLAATVGFPVVVPTEPADSAVLRSTTKKCSCCCGRHGRVCGAKCCCSGAETPNTQSATTADTEDVAGVVWVGGVSARRCLGEVAEWLVLGQATLAPPPAAVRFDRWVLPTALPDYLSAAPCRRPSPPTPPPRLPA